MVIDCLAVDWLLQRDSFNIFERKMDCGISNISLIICDDVNKWRANYKVMVDFGEIYGSFKLGDP